MRCRVLLCVQRNFLLGLRLGMTDETALFSMPLIPGSLIACRSTASASARLILSSAAASRADPDESPLQFSSDMLRCEFAVVLVHFSRSGIQDTLHPLIEVSSANVRPPNFVLHQNFARGTKHHLRGPLHSDLNVELSLPSGDRGTARIPSIRSAPVSPTQEFSSRSPHVS